MAGAGGSVRDRGEVVSTGDFLEAGDLEGSLKSYTRGKETLAWGVQNTWYSIPSQLLECGHI